MNTSEPLDQDTLFLACTRPAMFGGVTMEAMALNVMATSILFLVLGSKPGSWVVWGSRSARPSIPAETSKVSPWRLPPAKRRP